MIETLFIPNNSIASFALLYTKAGMRNESCNERGIAHLTEHVLLNLLSEKVKRKYGMAINGYTRKEYTTYVIYSTKYDLMNSTYLFEELLEIIFNFRNNQTVEKIINKQKVIVYEEEMRTIKNNLSLVALNKIQSAVLNNGLNNSIIDVESKIMHYGYSEISEFLSNNYNNFIAVIIGVCADTYKRIVEKYGKHNYSTSVNSQNAIQNTIARSHRKFAYYMPELDIKYTGWSIERARNLKEHIAYEILVRLCNADAEVKGVQVKYFNYSDQAMILETNRLSRNNTSKDILKIKNIGEIFHGIKHKYVFQLTELLQFNKHIAGYAIKARHLYNESGDPENWLAKVLDITEDDINNALLRINCTIIE